jgi:putative lipoic acid-binding regulatory protein
MDADDRRLGLQFPCRFPVKVMGEANESFESVVAEIVERHAGRVDADCLARRQSRNGRYVSLTFEITANSREQLDGLYRELSGCSAVSFVL